MKAFCFGLPGWINSSFTACFSAHSASAKGINSGPLSMRSMTGVIPRVSLPSQNLEKFWKTVPWVSLCHCLQRDNNGFVTRGIRAVMINRSAQVQTPAGLTDTESKCRYQMSDQLTLKGRF